MAGIATGDVKDDILYLLLNEFSGFGDAARTYLKASGMSAEQVADEIEASFKPIGRSCSMISAWGSRTVNGALYTGRNLDWVRFPLPLPMFFAFFVFLGAALPLHWGSSLYFRTELGHWHFQTQTHHCLPHSRRQCVR
jgi:hypothetical protein